MLSRVRYTEVAGTGSYTARVRHNILEESVYVYTIYVYYIQKYHHIDTLSFRNSRSAHEVGFTLPWWILLKDINFSVRHYKSWWGFQIMNLSLLLIYKFCIQP